MIKVYGVGNYKNKLMNTYEIFDDYAILTTSNGFRFKVNISDIDILKEYRWYGNGRKYSNSWVSGKHIQMHRFIVDAKKGETVDHINRDTSDNRRCNLRIITQQENSYNFSNYKTNTSGVQGVTWKKNNNKWCAQIQANKKKIHLGLFDDLEDAKNAYNDAKIKYHIIKQQ